MADGIATYSACKIALNIEGERITGFDEDDMITVEYDEQGFIKKVGADGEVGRSHICSKSGKITINLMQTSKANDTFSKLYLRDYETVDGTGMIQSISIVDLLGTSKYTVTKGWIQQLPSSNFSKEFGGRTWVIDCALLNAFVGGSRTQLDAGEQATRFDQFQIRAQGSVDLNL